MNELEKIIDALKDGVFLDKGFEEFIKRSFDSTVTETQKKVLRETWYAALYYHLTMGEAMRSDEDLFKLYALSTYREVRSFGGIVVGWGDS